MNEQIVHNVQGGIIRASVVCAMVYLPLKHYQCKNIYFAQFIFWTFL